MSERWRNILVGLMSIAGLVCLAVILMLIGYVPQWMEKGYTIGVELNDAAGLTGGSRVKLSGIDIGRVRSVDLQPLPRRGVFAAAVINEGVAVPARVKVSVQGPILGGSPSLALIVSHLEPEELTDLLPTDGSARVTGQVPSLASMFADELKAALSEPFEHFAQFTERWSDVAETVNEMFELQSVEAVDAGEVPGNIRTVLIRADQRLTELKQTIASLNAWFGDEQFNADVRETARQVAGVMKKLDSGADRLSKLADEAGGSFERLTRRYIGVADDMSGAIHKIRQVAEKAGEGEGTVAKLLNDPSLYNNLNDALERINEAIKELQLLVQKWKQEGVPVSF